MIPNDEVTQEFESPPLRQGDGDWAGNGGISLSELLVSGRIDLNSFFNLAIRLSTILAELHRQNTIHRNLNPRGILCNPATGEVRLADFSLAVKAVDEIQDAIPRHLLHDILA